MVEPNVITPRRSTRARSGANGGIRCPELLVSKLHQLELEPLVRGIHPIPMPRNDPAARIDENFTRSTARVAGGIRGINRSPMPRESHELNVAERGWLKNFRTGSTPVTPLRGGPGQSAPLPGATGTLVRGFGSLPPPPRRRRPPPLPPPPRGGFGRGRGGSMPLPPPAAPVRGIGGGSEPSRPGPGNRPENPSYAFPLLNEFGRSRVPPIRGSRGFPRTPPPNPGKPPRPMPRRRRRRPSSLPRSRAARGGSGHPPPPDAPPGGSGIRAAVLLSPLQHLNLENRTAPAPGGGASSEGRTPAGPMHAPGSLPPCFGSAGGSWQRERDHAPGGAAVRRTLKTVSRNDPPRGAVRTGPPFRHGRGCLTG